MIYKVFELNFKIFVLLMEKWHTNMINCFKKSPPQYILFMFVMAKISVIFSLPNVTINIENLVDQMHKPETQY